MLAWFFSHPSFTHALLLGGDFVASGFVAWGIIWENPKRKPWQHTVGERLVIMGVVFEAMFNLALFAFDETISHAQQAKIIALETEIAPRDLSDDQIDNLKTLLNGKTHEILHIYSATDPESQMYAQTLMMALRNASVSVTLPEANVIFDTDEGTILYECPSNGHTGTVATIFNAFGKIGLYGSFSTPLPSEGPCTIPSPALIVGPKPPMYVGVTGFFRAGLKLEESAKKAKK
jgi:hypothetical protein